jgi:translation elongation factor EF-Tu-like GTPase
MQCVRKIRAWVHLLRTEEGGKRIPFRTDYRPSFNFEPGQTHYVNDGRIVLLDRPECGPGEECLVEIEFLCPEALPPTVDVGVCFNVQEGGWIVGSGEVLEVLETGPWRSRR